jgi:hypothetical protein
MLATFLHQTYLDLHIMIYKIDKIILAVSLVKCQNTWFLLQPLPCNKNRSYCFNIEQIQYFIYVLWQNKLAPQSICIDIDAQYSGFA